MNLLLFQNDEVLSEDGESTISIEGRRLQHLRQVLKVQVGAKVKVGQLNGKIGVGEVTDLDDQKAKLKFELKLSAPVPSPLQLCLALPRPKNLPRILQTIVQLGIKDIHFFHSYRVEKSFWTSDYLDESSVRKALILGLEQAVDTVLPTVQFHRYFRPFVEDSLPELSKGRRKLIAHPYSEGAQPIPSNEPATLIVGPEGGLIDFEVGLLEANGFTGFRFGERILKVEPAIAVLAALIVKI